MNKTIFISGVVLGALAVVLGAFAAHGLEKVVAAEAIATFETGVKYQMYHALVLLVLGSLQQLTEKDKKWVYYFFVLGIALFSFSIYLLALNSLTSFDFKIIGVITPIGGVFLIMGWVLLGYKSWKLKSWK